MKQNSVRRFVLLALTTVALLILGPSIAAHRRFQNVVPTFSNPTFWTCRVPHALPAIAQASTAVRNIGRTQVACGENEISGVYMLVQMALANGGVPAGTVVIQTVSVAGILGATTATSTTCGDDLKPFVFKMVEHFSTPANDLHMMPFCCENTLLSYTKAQVAFLPLPAGAKPIPAGNLANAAYTTAAQKTAIRNRVRQNSTLYWGYTYEYDG